MIAKTASSFFPNIKESIVLSRKLCGHLKGCLQNVSNNLEKCFAIMSNGEKKKKERKKKPDEKLGMCTMSLTSLKLP